jgi:thiol-disulfide isomerase/thioredoxin
MKWIPVLSAILIALACSAQADTRPQVSNAPEFTHVRADEWINSKPLALSSLRGKAVLIEFWTFDCINCLRSAAWVKKLASEKSDRGLVVVGVHTPELPQERDVSNVRRAVGKLGIKYPVMIDGDYSYWKAMGNQYWPAFYLIDADGRLRSTAIGEMHIGESRALQLERMIDELLPPRSSLQKRSNSTHSARL